MSQQFPETTRAAGSRETPDNIVSYRVDKRY